MYENAKKLRSQAFSASLMYQYAESFMDPKIIDKSYANLIKDTMNLEQSLKELSNSKLSTIDDIVKWAFKFEELDSLFYQSDDFKSISHSIGMKMAEKLTESVGNFHVNNYEQNKIDMIHSLSTVDEFYDRTYSDSVNKVSSKLWK